MFKLSNNIMVFTAVNYYYVSGMCSLYQLFQYKIGNASCGGDYQTLKELDVSATDMMEKYKFCGDKQHTLLDLILNKISPALINKAIIGEIDICNSHIRSLTNRHKSLTRNVCAIPDCKNLAEIRNSKKHGRVTFELASTIFLLDRQFALSIENCTLWKMLGIVLVKINLYHTVLSIQLSVLHLRIAPLKLICIVYVYIQQKVNLL